MRPSKWSVTGLVVTLVLVAVCAGFAAQEKSAGSADVESLYREKCRVCHDTGVPRAPNRAALAMMAAENIQFALTKGTMKTQGEQLTPAQIEGLSKFLSGTGSTSEAANRCQGEDRTFIEPLKEPRWNGWGVDTLQRRFQSAEKLSRSKRTRF